MFNINHTLLQHINISVFHVNRMTKQLGIGQAPSRHNDVSSKPDATARSNQQGENGRDRQIVVLDLAIIYPRFVDRQARTKDSEQTTTDDM